MSSLNVTNLLDTAFILLITFMLIAPQLEPMIKVDLPQVKEAPVQSPPTDKTVILIVRRDDDGSEAIFYRDVSTEKRIAFEEIRDMIGEHLAKDPNLNVVIEADRESRTGIFVNVLNEVQRAGIESIGIRTEEPE